MAKSRTPEPVTITVVRLGKSYSYQLADMMDWAVLFENEVLEVKSAKPLGRFYWPLGSVTFWKVEPLPGPHA
jgi:hypothetical protein